MPSYKLIYFNGRGRAELCRLLFALAGQDYEDERLDSDKWKAFKPETLTGQMPVMKIDGRLFSQSGALAKYLAKEFGLYGKSNLEGLQIDEVVGILNDLFTQAIKVMFAEESKKEELAKEFKEKHAPTYLTALAKLLKMSGTGFFVGSAVTLADVAVYDLLFNLKSRFEGLLDNFPTLAEQNDRIHSLDKIKQYVAKRPQTQF